MQNPKNAIEQVTVIYSPNAAPARRGAQASTAVKARLLSFGFSLLLQPQNMRA